MRSAVRNWRADRRQMTRLDSRSARRAAMSSKLIPPRPRRVVARATRVLMCSIFAHPTPAWRTRSQTRPNPQLHRCDELLDAFVDAAVRVLAQDGPLGLVVQLEV